MYILSKVVNDYEGTWSNPLFYDTDLDNAIMIANDLQDSMISLKKIFISFQEKVKVELEKFYPNYDNYEIDFSERIQSVDQNDSENYFEKEIRLFKELADTYLNKNERFLNEIHNVKNSTGLVYFEVKKMKTSQEVLNTEIEPEKFWKIDYSTQPKAQEYIKLFQDSIID